MATYDPASIGLNFAEIAVKDFMDDSFLEVDRYEDSFFLHTGAQGTSARARNNNRSGYIKFSLQQTSKVNDLLAAKMKADEDFGTGTGDAQMKDTLGTTLAGGADAYLLRPAAIKRGKEIVGTEWTIVVPKMDMLPGSASVA